MDGPAGDEVIPCPACGKDMKPAHIVCPYCIADGALKHPGRRQQAWIDAHTARIVEAALWSR